MIWEPYYPVLHSCMNLNISITIGPFFPPQSYAMRNLIYPIEIQMNKIKDIYDSYLESNIGEFSPVYEMDFERVSYFQTIVNADFADLNMDDFYTIKNGLLGIRDTCDIIKPKDITAIDFKLSMAKTKEEEEELKNQATNEDVDVNIYH